MTEDWWNGETATSSEPLTLEKLEAAFEAVKNAQVGPSCPPHLVGPNDEGWTLCANCAGPIYVVTQSDGRKRLGVPPVEKGAK